MKKTLIASLVLSFWIIQCSHLNSDKKTVADNNQGVEVLRYLAWIEGDLQRNYNPDREITREKLNKLKGKIPAMTDTNAYLHYLAVLDASGRKTEAEKYIKEYLESYPNEKRAIFLLGVHYLREKKEELANYFFSHLEKDKDFQWKSLLYNNLGMLALKEGDRSEAMEHFERATKTSPHIAAPYVNLGALYLQSRSYEAAEKVLSKAVEIDKGFEDAALGLGVALEGLGNYAAAYQVYAKYIDANPGALSVLYNQSLVLGNHLNRRSEAAQMMLRYIQRGGKQTAKAQKIMEKWR